MSDHYQLMAAGGDAGQSSEGSNAAEKFLDLCAIAKDLKRRKLIAGAQGAVAVTHAARDQLVSSAPRAGGIVSEQDKQEYKEMLSTICESGLGGLQNQASSSTVIVVQDGREIVMNEGTIVRDQKVSKNFHVVCPNVDSLKKNETLNYKVCKNDDRYDFVVSSSTGQDSNISATVCLFDTNVDVFETISKPQPHESDLHYNLSQLPSGTFQIQSVSLCKLADSSYNLPKGTLLVYSVELYAGVKNRHFEVPKFLIRKKFAGIRDKFPGVVLESPSSKQEKFQHNTKGFYDELPAHAHCLRMFDDPENRVWYKLSIFIDLCDFNRIELNSDKSYEPLKQVFQTLNIDASSCLKIQNLYEKAEEVVVPLCRFQKLSGDNQFCCRSDTFFSLIKVNGVKHSSSITVLSSMFKTKPPQINCCTIFQKVPVSQLENKIREAFMIETPKDKFSCGTIASQMKRAIQDKNTSLPAKALEISFAVIVNQTLSEMPIDLSGVLQTTLFGKYGLELDGALGKVNKDYMIQQLCEASFLESGDFSCDKPDLSDTVATDDIVHYALKDFLDKNSYSCDEFIIFLLHMVLDLKGDSNFGRLIDVFDIIFVDKLDKFTVSADCTDHHLQRMSHLYFISSMIGGMLATCDLLLVDRVITCFPSDEFRKQNFTNFDDGIFSFLWDQYANTPGTRSFNSKNLNAAAPHYTFGLLDWVCYFATCQLTRSGQDLDLKKYAQDAVKDFAAEFVKGIADFNAGNYINHGDDRKIPTLPLSASMQNFCMTLGEHIQNLPAGKFSPNIYEVKPRAAVADGDGAA